jgi:hypothetical protein
VDGVLAVGGDHYNHVLLAVGYNDHPLTQPHQVGVYSAVSGNDNVASPADGFVCGFETALKTDAGSFTLPLLAHFAQGSVTKGAGTTIERTVCLKVVDESAGTHNACIAKDGSTFTGNWFINYEGTRASYLGGALAIGGDLTMSGASEIQNDATDQFIRLRGGTSGSTGGNIICFGPTHASASNTVQVNGSSGVNITGPTNITGNIGVGTSTFGTSATRTLALFNGTVPSTSPADTVQLFSVDLSAGNATLGIRTETAVVTESVTSDRTLSVNINGTVYKICLKA